MNFKNKKGCIQILKQYTQSEGYRILSFGDHTNHAVHRLVATAFIPNIDQKPQIDHINGDPSDNRVDNLRWATAKENKRNLITAARSKASYKEIANRADVKAKLSKRSREQWQNDEFRKNITTKLSIAGKARFSDTNERIKLQKAALAQSVGVYCVETGQVFASQSEAARLFNVHASRVSKSYRLGVAVINHNVWSKQQYPVLHFTPPPIQN